MNINQQERAIIQTLRQFSPQPSSLLDVGCGEGAVIKYCQKNLKIEVMGIDQHEETVEQLITNGVKAKVGDARVLPFSDEQFEWVIIANVLHHIPNANKALNECLRVAQFGVIASELWYDRSIKLQQYGHEIDTWCKTLHQALGFYHRRYLNSGEIIALIHKINVASIDVHYGLNLIETTIDYWLNDQQDYLEQLPKNHVLLWELENLKAKLKNKPLCEPGWLQVILKKAT
ncbi:MULTISPECIES: class I SAM-dependent methyltransferase [Legionella]|nr:MULTISPECIES: class I SAM-dependent methyltransferase [Legionella]